MPDYIYLDNPTPAQRQSLENFRYILRNMEDAVCLTSMEGELLYANAAGEKLLEIKADIIRKHKGTIIEFLGDGIFVVFGAPQDLPEHAREAVICAIEMQNAMEEVNAWNREMGYPLMEMGIGISTGDVVAGNIGSDQKMKYGCMGATVNLAGRLESCCIGWQIKISENTRNQISDELNIVEENTFIPKGFRNGIKYYSIAGLGAQHVAEDRIRWREIPGGTAVQFYILNGKIVEGESNTGRITEVSVDGKYGKWKRKAA